jgi:SH3-like domain-containing protein
MALTATLLLCAALAAGGTAWWGHRALDASGLAVVRRPETLRTAPEYNANTSGGVATGDVVRLASAQEGWVRVEHTDGRRGWILASRVAPLVAGSLIR